MARIASTPRARIYPHDRIYPGFKVAQKFLFAGQRASSRLPYTVHAGHLVVMAGGRGGIGAHAVGTEQAGLSLKQSPVMRAGIHGSTKTSPHFAESI